MAQIAILGAGVMGSALSYPLRDNGHGVSLIGTHLDGETVSRVAADGYHPRLRRELAPGVRPFFFEQLAEGLAGADLVVLGVSSQGVRWAAEVLGPHLRPGVPLFMITKGLAAEENGDLLTFPQLLQQLLPPTVRETVPIGAVGGPSIAGELAARRHTCVVFTCGDQGVLDAVAPLFATPYYHLWTSTDLIGVEVCVALKNIYALGVGLVPGVLEATGGLDGGVAMHNHAAAFFAQGLAEMSELVGLMGGKTETIFGLPGAGDLYVTCQGGRNSRMGRLLGMGVDPEEAAEQLAGETVEGVDAVAVIAPAVQKLVSRQVLPAGSLPLLRYIYAVAVKGHALPLDFGQFFGQQRLALQPVTPRSH